MGIFRIIVAHLYQPSSAATNRIVAYSRGFAELGCQVVLLLGHDGKSPLPDIAGVEVVGVSSSVHQLLMPKMARTAKKYYNSKNSAILVYGTPSLCIYMPRQKYTIFYECTEVPFYGMRRTWKMRIKESLKMHLAKRATGMFVISQALKDYFSKNGIENIAVINMFVDIGRFKGKNEINDGKIDKYIAYCGKISNFKDGLDCLVKAFKIFHNIHSNYKLKLIGDFRFPEFEKELRSLISSLSLEDCIELTGAISAEKMPELLCGAQMLALARPNNDQAKYGFPTKLGEYLATGNPVVVTNVGEIGQFLKDGVNCKMAEPDSPEDFAEKMMWVADHYDEALALGKQGRKLTETEFSCIEQSKKALNFMNQIIG